MKKSSFTKVASAAFFVVCGLLFTAQTVGRAVNVTTLELHGGGCGVADNGPAIQAAHDSTALVLDVGACTYTVVTPVVLTKRKFSIRGKGRYISVFSFLPGADATFLKFDGSSAQIFALDIRDFSIISSDTTHSKTAVRFIDVSSSIMSNVTISRTNLAGGLWTGGSSVCLQTNGRDTTTFEKLELYCSKALVLAENPTVYLSTDHYNFRDIYIVGDSTGPCIQSAAVLTNLTFDGMQAWAGCKGGFKASNAPISVASWNDVAFNNIRNEQSPDPTVPDIEINVTTANLRGLNIFNTQLNAGGIKLRGVLGWSVIGGQASCGNANILDVNTSDDQGFWAGVRTEAACTMTPSSGTAMTMAGIIANPTGSVIPATAHFFAAAAALSSGAPLLFGGLPTCNAAHKGARGFITDGNSATYRTASGGGGATNIGVLCDGTNWLNN